MTGFINWLKNPLSKDGSMPSTVTLFLLIGLVLVGLAVWGFIFSHIRAAI